MKKIGTFFILIACICMQQAFAMGSTNSVSTEVYKKADLSLSNEYIVLDKNTISYIYVDNPYNLDYELTGVNSDEVKVNKGDNLIELEYLKAGVYHITLKSRIYDESNGETREIVNSCMINSRGREIGKTEIDDIWLPNGASEDIMVLKRPKNLDLSKYQWKSLNEEVAFLEDGKIKSLQCGNTRVEIRDELGDIIDTFKVFVYDENDGLKIEGIDFYDDSRGKIMFNKEVEKLNFTKYDFTLRVDNEYLDVNKLLVDGKTVEFTLKNEIGEKKLSIGGYFYVSLKKIWGNKALFSEFRDVIQREREENGISLQEKRCRSFFGEVREDIKKITVYDNHLNAYDLEFVREGHEISEGEIIVTPSGTIYFVAQWDDGEWEQYEIEYDESVFSVDSDDIEVCVGESMEIEVVNKEEYDVELRYDKDMMKVVLEDGVVRIIPKREYNGVIDIIAHKKNREFHKTGFVSESIAVSARSNGPGDYNMCRRKVAY